MNDPNQLSMLQSLLDHYRTKYYQAEYDIAVLQLQAKSTIQGLEQRIQQLSGVSEEADPGEIGNNE